MSAIGRQDDLVAQNVAANLEQQQAHINQLQGRGEMIKQQQEINMYNQEMSGYSNQYNAGQANVMGGISNTAGTLASGFAQGGAFTNLGGNGGALQPYATGINAQAPQGLAQPTIQPITTFQPLTNR